MAEKENSFNANPNQKVYDMPHQVDHLVEVFDIYFAEQIKVYKNEPKSEVVIATKNTIVKAILAPFKKDKKKFNITSTPSDPKTVVKKGESATVNWQEKVEDGFDYLKINKIKVGKKLFIVTKCSGDKAKLTIEIFENKLTNAEAVYDNPVKFLIGKEEKTKIEFSIKAFQPNFQYEQEITLKPKSKEEYKKLIDKFNKRKDKNAFLYLKADVTDTISDINFTNGLVAFQNAEGNRFKVSMLNNGYYFNYDGTFEESVFIDDDLGNIDDVYACKLSDDEDIIDIKKLNIKYLKFIENASTAYGESSIGYGVIDKYELYAIASVHKRNSIAYGVNSNLAVKFRKTKDEKRNNTSMVHGIAGEINALLNGTDYSNGAKQWDGAEQTNLPVDADSSSNGTFMFKINVMGWDISDEHYNSWKLAVSNKFGSTYFNAPQKKYAVANYGGMTNKDKIRLKSAAQYGLTMFWTEINTNKPK